MHAAAQNGAIEVTGRRLAWRSVGEGPPLLLVNGYAATAADWDPQLISSLAQSLQVICPDNRGVGDSGLGEPGALTVDAMAEDLAAVLDALHIESTPVAGWSMGGFVTQRLAARAPRRVSSLVLLSTDPGGAAATLAESQAWARLTDHSGTPREQASRLISLLFPPDLAPAIDERFGDVVATARAQLSAAALRAQEAAMVAWHEEEQPVPEAGSPRTLIVHGTEDVVIPAANAATLAKRWSGQLELFAGGGHAFMAQEPERLAALVATFLRT